MNSVSNLSYPSFHSTICDIWEFIKKISIRPLHSQEIEQLRSNNNQSNDLDWNNLFIIQPTQEKGCVVDLCNIHDCIFLNTIYLSAQHGFVCYNDEIKLPASISHTTFQNCYLFDGIYVNQNAYIENTIILPGSIVMGNGRITCNRNTMYGNGIKINIGNETGGIIVNSTADLFYTDLIEIRKKGIFTAVSQSSYLNDICGDFSILGPNCFIESCPLLHSVCLFSYSHILSSYIRNSTILSSSTFPSKISSGTIVDSILQWGVTFETGSNCFQSILCEHTETSCNAKIVNSIIAPNTCISSGECNSSLVGPFIGFHHNSVLISAIWFEGKGNIGYGANIGSNHTGRLPDQECYPGEGVFFGLGCNIKYPCNFLQAPYSIISSGITLLPQRVSFPFSLINHSSQSFPSISPALNISF